MGKNKNGFTDKEEAFIREYPKDNNGTKAATRAGYSEKSAKNTAAKLMAKSTIREAIAKTKMTAAERCGISLDRVLLEYKRLAFYDPKRMYDDEGNLKSVHDIDDDTAAAIAGISNEELFEGRGENRKHVGTLKHVRIFEKKAALTDLMKHLGGFEKDNAQRMPDTLVMADIKDLPADIKMQKLAMMMKRPVNGANS